jgi:hypothetical protein
VTAFVAETEIAGIASLLVGTGGYYVGWGTGSGQVQGDTALASEASTPRVISTPSGETTNFPFDTARHTVTLTADADLAISEVGAFNQAIGDPFSIYGDFDVINLANGDAIVFQINIIFAAG